MAANHARAQQRSGPLPVPQESPDTEKPSTAAVIEEKPTKYEISASGDFLIGQGTVTLPLLFSYELDHPGQAVDVKPRDRNSQYFGGTLSFSFGQAWYFDVSYANGDSSGTVPVTLLSQSIDSDFSIKDAMYQTYVRYTFPRLRGRPFSAYLRAGATYADTKLGVLNQDFLANPAGSIYAHKDKMTDVMGNVGFGLLYRLPIGNVRTKVFLQLEGEAFYGFRDQESVEAVLGSSSPRASIENSLYGGLGRSTVRIEHALGGSGLLKVFADGGLLAKWTSINYDAFGSFNARSFGELLWGPYVKVGLRYSF